MALDESSQRKETPPEVKVDWETFSTGERARLLDEARALVASGRADLAAERARSFRPDTSSVTAYEKSLASHREALARMLGWPLVSRDGRMRAEVVLPKGKLELMDEDELGGIYHLRATGPADGLGTSGLLFLPRELISEITPEDPAFCRTDNGELNECGRRWPLVITQHGGLGSPELAAGLTSIGSANYNALITDLRKQPVVVFAPQLLVWHHGLEPKFDQYQLDRDLRQLGGSRAALDVVMLQRSLDWLLASLPWLDASRIGMAGLSYGGFYTLLFAALDPRIRAAVSSCFVNDRYRYNREDMAWTGSAKRFLDAEIARMICPRPLFLEAGSRDSVFTSAGFGTVCDEVAAGYASLGLEGSFRARVHDGGHEYDPDGAATEFLLDALAVKNPSVVE